MLLDLYAYDVIQTDIDDPCMGVRVYEDKANNLLKHVFMILPLTSQGYL